ncbi:MAG: 2-C-methyl-D-erythritol 4-phosphate cytidylyltransferase, partial [Pyrinomonadaceae bacterium]|nr:2-C-methyl-D-erythritol 4-phosphate cytidylyltransferase [Pyrinomonadaceae bacterium]
IKEVEDGRVRRTLERATLRHAMTPQCFQYALLREAYEHAGNLSEEITDDSALVEQLGVKVAVVEGDSRNIKITRPEDLALAEILLKQESEVRSQETE